LSLKHILASMKKIGEIAVDGGHEAFAGILRGKGIDFETAEGQGAVEFWAIEEEDHPDAQEMLLQFLEDPSSELWKEDLARGKKAQAIEKKEDLKRRVQAKAFKVRNSGQGTKISLVMIYASVIIFVLSHLNPELWEMIYFWSIFSLDGQFGGLTEGQIWRVVTPIFLHFGPLHILFNSLWMLDLGRSLEARMGSPFMIYFVLMTGGLSNLLQYMLSGPGFGGLSGVVYGLLGYIWVRGRRDPSFGLGVSPQTMMFMMGWLVLGFLATSMQIANGAHLGGLVVGALLAWVELKRKGLV